MQKDCREVYDGKVIGRDAFADLRFMDALMDAKRNDNWTNTKGFLTDAPQGVGLDEESTTAANAEDTASSTDAPAADLPPVAESFRRRPPEATPMAPFLGSAVITEADIDAEVFRYLDRNALFAGQWMLRDQGRVGTITRRCFRRRPRRCCTPGVDAALHQ